MTDRSRRPLLTGLFFAAALLASCTMGALLTLVLAPRLMESGPRLFTLGPSDEPPSPSVEASFRPFWEAWNIVEENYVDPEATDPETMTYGAIRGMLDSLGDVGHTRFLSPEERAFQESAIAGEFAGIGAEIGEREGRLVIVAPLEGSPAEAAGIRAGDLILEINGESTEGLNVSEAVLQIRGERGTEITLTVLHPEAASTEQITITRDTIELPAASWTMLPNQVAYIRMNQFAANLHETLEQILAEAEAEGAERYLIDMRNNPGGLVEQVIAVTSEFVPEGVVFIERNRAGDEEIYQVRGEATVPTAPIVVLINEGSASAAEIFSGALKDQERATLVGERTFGTGTVLRPFALSDGSALLLGIAEWLTPSGHLIKGNGIEPTIEVALPPEVPPVSPRQVEGMGEEELLALPDNQFVEAYQQLLAE